MGDERGIMDPPTQGEFKAGTVTFDESNIEKERGLNKLPLYAMAGLIPGGLGLGLGSKVPAFLGRQAALIRLLRQMPTREEIPFL